MQKIKNVDFHSHIISQIDDGAKNIEESIAMLKVAKQSGASVIVATPHYYPARGYETEYNAVLDLVNELRVTAEENNIGIDIVAGQEVGYTKELVNLYDDGNIGTINGTKYMLIELPLRGFSSTEVMDSIYELKIKGIIPIIAHPERYGKFQKNPEEINKFIEEGYLFQLNIGSLAGEFGSEAAKLAKLYVKHKVYSVYGSDGHRVEGRNTDMSEGVGALSKLNPDYVKEMNNNGQNIIADKSVRFCGTRVKNKKGIFRLLMR